jgi:hypothetical protein
LKELDDVLDQEALDHLADEAKVPLGTRVLTRKPIDRRQWFQGQVHTLARTFLAEANEPTVRSISAELLHLRDLLDAVLRQKPPLPVPRPTVR